jgi:hypothetical protein
VAAALLLPLALASAPAPVQAPAARRPVVIFGSVFDSIGAAVVGADVRLLGTDVVARSGEDGGFVLRAVEPATYLLRVRRLGFTPRTATIDASAAPPGDSLSLAVELAAAPVALPEVVVEALERKYVGRLATFAERMRTSAAPRSSFVTRDELDRMNPTRVSDVVKLRGRRAADCLGGLVYVDGVLATPQRDVEGTVRDAAQSRADGGVIAQTARSARRGGSATTDERSVDFIDPNDVEAMEIYRGPSEIPTELNMTARSGSKTPGCVIVIWTR